MTQIADQQRSKRQAFAAPGGTHDRVVRTLAIGLPSIIGVLTAYMVLAPLTQRSEVSFLLDKNKVEIARERLRVTDALYRGQDSKGQPFSLTANGAVQRTSKVPVVELNGLTARILLNSGPAELSANRGAYDMDKENVEIMGPVQFNSANGFRLTTSNVDIDLKTQRLESRGAVQGRIPSGTFSADRLQADLNERRVVLDGRARLRMVPGEMRGQDMGF